MLARFKDVDGNEFGLSKRKRSPPETRIADDQHP